MVTQTMIDSAKAGDAFAFEQIYNETIKGAYYVARKFLGTDTAAEDVLQESYTKVYEKLGEYQAGNFQGWVDVIVANKCKDYLKKKNPLLFSEMESDDGVEFDQEDTSDEFRPDVKVDYDETKRLVKEIIDKLPIDQKMSVIMFYYEQMSVKEIATAMECSENTIKSRLNYGRKTIKAEVEKLEKKGTKLYCAPILPFLLWLFREEAKACEIPVNFTVGNAFAKKAVEAGTASAKINIASATVAKAGLSIGAKIGIGVVATVLVAGGIGTAVFFGTNQQKEPIGIPVTVYVATDDGIEASKSASSESEEINLEDIVKEFMANYDGNNYVKFTNGRYIINNEGKYFYYGKDGVQIIIVENVSRMPDGSADDLYVYTFFSADKTTGEINEMSYSGTAFEKRVVGCDLYIGSKDTIVRVFDGITNDTGLDMYYKYSADGTTVTEEKLSTDEGVRLTSDSDYLVAQWTKLGTSSSQQETSTDNTGSDATNEREWDDISTDNPYFDFHGFHYLPIETPFATGEWTHAYTKDTAGLEGVFKADGSPIEMTLKYDENKQHIIEITLDTHNTDQTNLFPMSINGVSWNTTIEEAKEILGEPTSTTLDGLYRWYWFKKGNCILTFGYRIGGGPKYMKMTLFE